MFIRTFMYPLSMMLWDFIVIYSMVIQDFIKFQIITVPTFTEMSHYEVLESEESNGLS